MIKTNTYHLLQGIFALLLLFQVAFKPLGEYMLDSSEETVEIGVEDPESDHEEKMADAFHFEDYFSFIPQNEIVSLRNPSLFNEDRCMISQFRPEIQLPPPKM